jgi:D-3-phosphoglycerate dehydrogenase
MAYKVIITDSSFPDNQQEREILEPNDCNVLLLQSKDESLLKRELRDADALLVQWAPITRGIIETLDKCKIIVRYGIGVDNIDLEAARDHSIPVSNVPDYCINEVSDHTIALAVAALRQVIEADRRIRSGKWSIGLPRAVSSFCNLNFCVAGFGRIGREVARRAVCLGFRVKVYDPYVEVGEIESLGVTAIFSSEELFGEADVLSLHLPLNEDTFHFINNESIKKMRSGSVIVNTSRGGLIDTEALAFAINNKVIWGAALDVFEQEPLPHDHVLFDIPGVILSSHVAWYSSESFLILQKKAAEEALRAVRGEPLLNQVIK